MNISNEIIHLFEEDIANLYHSSPRLSQVQMSLDVADFLVNSSERIMFVEAPVGTGKTLGVLVPSLLYAKEFNYKITYATATKNLQSQIINSEIPQLQKLHMIKCGETILAMGKSNYACISHLEENINDFSLKRYMEIHNALIKVKTGSRDELEKGFSIKFSEYEWNKINLASYTGNCSNYMCKGHQHRKEFHRPHKVTVTNHDMAIQSWLNEKNKKRSLVPIMGGVLIIDEAHLFDENFLGRTQIRLNLKQLYSFFEGLSNDGQQSLERIESHFNNLGRQKYGKSGRHPVAKKLESDLRIILKDLQKIDSINDNFYNYQYDEITTALSAILNKEVWTSWISVDDGNSFNVISNQFYKGFSDAIKYLSRRNKIIFLSGTLTATTDPITELQRNWKLNNFKYKSYDTPFNVYDQAYIYVPNNIHLPKSEKLHHLDIKNELGNICRQVSGGILLLNNSLKMMDILESDIGDYFHGRKVFKQGRNSNEVLTENFKADEESILLGSGSFFSGFSVPGKSLSTVIITTLPFPVPEDPFVKLQQKTFCTTEEEMFSVLLNTMLKRLEQGIGRLIRQETDYGVVCITDPRVFTSNYGIKIQKWMKQNGYRIRQGRETLGDFMVETPAIIDEQTKFIENNYHKEKLGIPNINSNQQSIDFKSLKYQVRTDKKINHDLDKLKVTVKNSVKKVRQNHPGVKIVLRGLSNSKSEQGIAQVIVNAAYTAGINNGEFFINLPEELQKFSTIKSNSRSSGIVRISNKISE